MSRARAWCFTLNNYTPPQELFIQSIDCRYIIYGREVAPNTGTPHLQGFVYFDNAKTLSATKKLIDNTAHLEPAKADAQVNKTYCSKSGNVYERGDIPVEKSKASITTFEQCKSFSQVQFVKFNMCNDVPKRDFKTTVLWLYGPTGSGKSRKAHELAPTAYWKDDTKWWNGYYGQETVILDDLRPNSYFTFVNLLKLFDRYPMTLENKGGCVNFCSKMIIVTSPRKPEDLFIEYGEDIAQLLRRIETVECVPLP